MHLPARLCTHLLVRRALPRPPSWIKERDKETLAVAGLEIQGRVKNGFREERSK